MNELRPMRDEEGGDPFERALLGAAAGDRPPDGLRSRVLDAVRETNVGIGVGRGPAPLKLWKWLGGGLLCAAVGLMSFAQRARTLDASLPQPERVEARTENVPTSTEDTPKPVLAVPAAPLEPSPQATASSAVTRRRVVTPSVASASTDSIAEEVRLIDEARRTLNTGDTAGALQTLGRYQSRFPRGVLRPESIVLRVDALLRRGDSAGATAVARAFLASSPHGFHANRLRTMIGEAAEH